jgi:hypothetical protein
MTHQAFSLEAIQPHHVPPYTFFERFGALGTCVLPAEVPDGTPLPDPETGLTQPSLRQRCSQEGQLCYAQVLYACAEGLYWADVAATPDLVEAPRVVLTEAHLVYALAWDERLRWREPAQIRRLMQAHAEELAPLSSQTLPDPPAVLLPAPVVPLSVVTAVEVTTDELREAFEKNEPAHLPGMLTRAGLRRPGTLGVQQGLLCTLKRTLQELLEAATDTYTARVLHALTALVTRVQHWQRRTRQRVVNAARTWDAASNRPAWALTLGVPEALLLTV